MMLFTDPGLSDITVRIMKDRIAKKCDFRLGKINVIKQPSSPIEIAADELYERNGVGALHFPDGALVIYYDAHADRLSGEFSRLAQYGNQGINNI